MSPHQAAGDLERTRLIRPGAGDLQPTPPAATALQAGYQLPQLGLVQVHTSAHLVALGRKHHASLEVQRTRAGPKVRVVDLEDAVSEAESCGQLADVHPLEAALPQRKVGLDSLGSATKLDRSAEKRGVGLQGGDHGLGDEWMQLGVHHPPRHTRLVGGPDGAGDLSGGALKLDLCGEG